MIGEATTLESSPAGIDGDGFDVFASLRGGVESDNFSSGAGEAGGADTDEAVSGLDLVAVAGGKEKLDTTMSDTNSNNSSEISTPVDPDLCEKFGTIACVGCDFALLCAERQAAMVAKNNESQPTEQLSTLEQLLREDDAPGEIVWARPLSGDFDGGELPVADSPRVIETSADKTDGPTEKITPQEQESKASTSEPVEVSGEDTNIEAAEEPLFGLKTAPEIAADDTKDVGESRSESASEISDKGHFTETVEVSSPSIEVKPHVIDSISDADDDNKQSTPEFLDTLAQAETAPVSLAINKDTQTGDENSNPLENKTAYPVVGKDNVTASVVENTYNSDKTTAPSSVKTPLIEHQKEELVITGSKSANSEPSRAAENDESATPIPEQQHLAAQSDAVRADESAITELIDNSGTKAPIDTQPSEINIDAADYNNFVKSTDGVDVEQPKHVIPTAANVPPSQEQEDTGNVSVEYETNETSTKEAANVSAPIPAKEQPDQSAIVSLSTQDVVEYGEGSLSADEEFTVDRSPTRPDVVNKPTTHEVMEVTHEAGETIELEAMKVTPPADAIAVSGGKNQIDLSPELNEELVVDKRVHEAQTFLVEQLDHNDAVVKYDYGEDNEAWAEEDVVFLVEQQSPAVELEVPSAEVVTIALPMEAITVCEEADDLKLSVGDDMDSVGQLDNSKVASVPEITNDYESVEQIAILASPATEPIPDIELDEAVESELGEQNDLAVAGAVDNYGYNSETSTVSDNILVVKNHPSLGLWSDDSRLNPEEEAMATIQSGATDTSLVSRLVGVLVVAICVARGRQASAILSSR